MSRGLVESGPLRCCGGVSRYDLLCLEGLARALRIFLGKEKVPDFRLSVSEEDAFQGKKPVLQMTARPEVGALPLFLHTLQGVVEHHYCAPTEAGSGFTLLCAAGCTPLFASLPCSPGPPLPGFPLPGFPLPGLDTGVPRLSYSWAGVPDPALCGGRGAAGGAL